MTPDLATSLTLHEPYQAETIGLAERLFPRPKLVTGPLAPRDTGSGIDDGRLPALWRRESLHRRLLGLFDVAGAGLALALVLGLTSGTRAAAATVAGALLLVLLFKLAGLYDRDELRIVHSTLDELPLLFQLTGLFALLVTIADSLLAGATLAGLEIATLWVVACASVAAGRFVARALAGRIAPVERCMVIGDPEHAARIRERLHSSTARATVVASLPLTGANFEALDTPASMRQVVDELRVHRIILAPARLDAGEVSELIRIGKAVGVRVSVLPRTARGDRRRRSRSTTSTG